MRYASGLKTPRYTHIKKLPQIQVINKMAIFAGLNLIQRFMLVERVANNQITISFSSGTDVFGIQRLVVS